MEAHRWIMEVQTWIMEVRNLPLEVCILVWADTNKNPPSPQMK